MTLSIMTLRITVEYCYDECHLCKVSIMLIVTNKPFMLSVTMQNVVMLSVLMLSVLMLSVIMLNVTLNVTLDVMLSVIRLNVVMLNVVAPV